MESARIRVLLVEDEDAHVELIARACEGLPEIALTVARSLREARDRLDESTPDLVLLDSLLPDGLGVEMLESGEPGCPVVLMTSQEDAGMADRARAAGAFRYVVKSPETLIGMPALIEETLTRWRGQIGEIR